MPKPRRPPPPRQFDHDFGAVLGWSDCVPIREGPRGSIKSCLRLRVPEAIVPTDFDFLTDDAKTQTAIRNEERDKAEEKDLRRGRWGRRWRVLKHWVKTVFILLLVGLFLWIFRERMFFSVDSGEVLLVYYRLF